MKIAFISAAQSSHTVKWVNALCRKGHTVRLYSLPSHENRLGNIDPGVEIVYLGRGGFSGYFLNAGELRRDLKSFSPDVVNAHYASGYGTLARLSRAHPLVLSVWGSDVYDFPGKSPFHKMLVAQNIQAADVLASTSRVMAEQVRRVFRYAKEIAVTPFGVDCSLFAPHPQEHGEFCVGTVKALEDKYGMEYLIRAFAQFSREMPDLGPRSLIIYGKGSKRDELQGLIDSLGLSGCASLCGAVPNTQVPEIINGIDVFCLPSILDSESFGVSAVEAMACGVPVIASDVDGFTETVEDGVTGFVVPRKDASAVAEKLKLLAKDPALREKMGRAGRERVLRLYDFQKNVEQMEEVYRKAVSLCQSGR
jgi:glycosyltransferase involved in cell wall biosynthesis